MLHSLVAQSRRRIGPVLTWALTLAAMATCTDAPAPADTGCPAHSAIDGKFTGWKPGHTCWEWKDDPQVTGVNGIFHIASPSSGELRFLNDWHLRKHPICPGLYNQFQFSTADGQAWEVRVFADQHLTVTLNGTPYTGTAEAAYAFGASPDVATPHTMFEFRLAGVQLGDIDMLLHDPIVGSNDPEEIAKCTIPKHLLVKEPTIVVFSLTASGILNAAAATKPTPVVLEPASAPAGSKVAVLGGLFGTQPGAVLVNGKPIAAAQWQDGQVEFVVPPLAAGPAKIQLQVGGLVTKALGLQVQAMCATDPDCAGAVVAKASQCEWPVCSDGLCVIGPAPSGTACDDGKKCTVGDSCSGQVAGLAACAGNLSCPPVDGKDAACLVVACASDGSGECAYGNKLVGTSCDDGNPCTDNDHCVVGGKCGAGNPKDCADDGNPCTQESCDPANPNGACVKTKLSSGEGCNDGNPCTSGDHCDGDATCQGSPVKCADDGNDCTTEYCDPVKGCSKKAAPDGGMCDDHDPDTKGEVCCKGICGVPAGPCP